MGPRRPPGACRLRDTDHWPLESLKSLRPCFIATILLTFQYLRSEHPGPNYLSSGKFYAGAVMGPPIPARLTLGLNTQAWTDLSLAGPETKSPGRRFSPIPGPLAPRGFPSSWPFSQSSQPSPPPPLCGNALRLLGRGGGMAGLGWGGGLRR